MNQNTDKFALLRAVVDKSWDEVLVIDTDTQQLVFANQAALDNLRMNEANCHVALNDLLGKSSTSKLLESFYNNNEDGRKEYTFRLKRTDNSSYPVRIRAQSYTIEDSSYLILNCVDVTEKQKAERELTYLANYDSLTGLPNRNLFFEHLQSAMNNADRNRNLVSLLFIDLDNFKNINDRYGHEVGDNLVREVGKRLLRSVRRTDTVSRLGGDEFTIVLSNIKTVDGVEIVVNKILEKLSAPFILNGQEIVTTASIGAAMYPFNESSDCYELLRQADAAMHHAKESGRKQFSFYSSDISLAELRRNKMEAALQMALKRNEFQIFYQPRVSLKDGKITGAEALLRWTNPDLGFVSPVEFVPVLESTGLINEVGKWVLENGCKQLKLWNDKGYNLRLSVNVSALQFVNGDFSQVFDDAILSSQVDPKFLEVEITEGVLLGNHEDASNVLQHIKHKGVHISLDDFGTGYSSLAYLKQFPIDILKIDRSFVMDLMHSHDSPVIVEAIIGLAKNLRLRVTAEGIEELEHVNFLLDRECDEGQGFFYGKPMPEFEFEQMLIEQGGPVN